MTRPPLIPLGTTVRVAYKTYSDGGRLIEEVSEAAPIEVEIGGGRLFPGLEREIRAMAVGQLKRVVLEAADAYGDYDPELVDDVNRGMFPADLDLTPGMALLVSSPDHGSMSVRVLAISNDKVTVDANHPLAGQRLEIEIKLISKGGAA